MFILLLLSGIGLVTGQLIKRDELDKYTTVAHTNDGEPCLGGCSATTNECVVNWFWKKKPCRIEMEPAPIYYTAERDERRICLSNCGNFGFPYEWCITTADNKWDYCSSQLRGAVPSTRNIVDSYTRDKRLCETECLNEKNKGYRCNINLIIWKYCAKQAISRIPILPSDYKIGDITKNNCEAFLTNLVSESFRANVSYFDSEYLPDGYLHEVADTIETAVELAPESGEFKDISGETGEGNSIKKYTMTKMIMANGTSVLVPAVIRAFVSNSTIRRNQPLIDLRIMEERNRRRRRRQLPYDDDGYFNWRIIGYELGGTDGDYNFFRQSPNLYESWLQMQRAINKWCENTGGSVDILAVVFYTDTHTILPKGLGTAMTFYNPDSSVFVSCKDIVYWNK